MQKGSRDIDIDIDDGDWYGKRMWRIAIWNVVVYSYPAAEERIIPMIHIWPDSWGSVSSLYIHS